MKSPVVCRSANITIREEGPYACLCVSLAGDPTDLRWYYFYPDLAVRAMQWNRCVFWLAKAVGAVTAGMRPPNTTIQVDLPLSYFQEH